MHMLLKAKVEHQCLFSRN